MKTVILNEFYGLFPKKGGLMLEYNMIHGKAVNQVLNEIKIESEHGWCVKHMILGNDGNPLVLLEREKSQFAEK
jgi:hypothetical protein